MPTPNPGILGVRISPVSGHEAGLQGANIVVELDHTCLTQAAANTPQTINLFDVLADVNLVELVRAELVVPYEDTTDAAFNTTTVIVGDTGSTARYLASMEINKNATEVREKAGTGTKFQPVAAGTVDIIFTGMAAKSLVNINKGLLRLFLRYSNANDI